MHPRLEAAWRPADGAYAAFAERLRAFSREGLASRESGGSWTPLQVAEHLWSAESGTLSYLRKKTSSGWESLAKSDDDGARRTRALLDSLGGGQRLEAPDVLPVPTGEIPRDPLLERWALVREEWKVFLDGLEEEYFDRQVFRHAIAGPMDVFQTLAFLGEHLRHHTDQLARIAATSGASDRHDP